VNNDSFTRTERRKKEKSKSSKTARRWLPTIV